MGLRAAVPVARACGLARQAAFSAQFGRREMSGKVFVVCCNPVGESFSNAIAESCAKGLVAGGNEVRSINLYKMPSEVGGGEFSPIVSLKERQEYFNENEQSALKEDGHVKYIVDSLRWSDSLVLIYPTWWFNIPAILKGFFDRCFVPGVGFRYDKVAQKRMTGLTNIKKVGVLTSYGFSEEEVEKAGDAGKVMISGGMTMLFAQPCDVVWKALYGMQGSQPVEVRTRFLQEVEEMYRAW
uniref:Flavodoxin-like fold domain-containing protein n=1 Tax=Hemiselmis tepida TaxID=464990 RepID=A0A7S0W3T5_9CRYP